MKQSIVSTLVFCFTLSTLSFAQVTETPKKKRNWIVGVGAAVPTYYLLGDNETTTHQYSITLGYRGFTLSGYTMPVFFKSLYSLYERADYINNSHLTFGYQYVFSKKSNAQVKPIVGLEYGLISTVLNTGVRYKRSQILFSVMTFGFNNLVNVPLWERNGAENYFSLKYQFLF
tara:strand:- start:3294 stop:3812 length:519 start_codon:yes stop_codon:yes gene_type:complete